LSKTLSKKVFAVGFSNGGYWAAALAARGDIDSGVNYYGAYSEAGTVIRSELESGSILEEAGSNSAPLLMFHDTDDSRVGLETAEVFEGLYPNVVAYYYDDVDHGFERKSRFDAYNEKAAKDSWGKTLEFLKKFL
jgi:dienelactone hydrolase